jgi:tetratricopeptide (TPR) repeat protein
VRIGRRREWRTALPLVAVAAGCVLLSNVIVHRPSHNFSEEYAFTGAALVHERDLDGAEAAYRRAISEDPSRAMGWNGLGVVALNRGLVEDAERSFQTALLREPSFARSHYLMGTALQRAGDLQGAVEQFKQAAAIRPDDTETQGALAGALMSTGAPADALVHYRIVQQRTPPTAALCIEMARAEGLLGHLDEARRLSEKAVALEPLNGRAWFILAEAQRTAGDLPSAEKSLEQAAGYLGAGVLEVRLAQAMLRRSQGRRDEAASILWRLVEEVPDSGDARRLLLGYAADDGELAKAQAALKRLDLERARRPPPSGAVAR